MKSLKELFSRKKPPVEAAPKKRSLRFRIPLRLQIMLLLTFFVFVASFIAFRSTFSFMEEDKMGSIREIQTMKVSDTSRDLNDRVQRVRLELREAAFRILDSERGKPQLDPKIWSWIRVKDKEWVSPDFDRKNFPKAGESIFKNASGTTAFRALLNPDNPVKILIAEPFKITQGNKETNVVIYGELEKKVLVGDPSRMNLGPVRGVLMEAADFSKWVPRNEQDVRPFIWSGVDRGIKDFIQIFLSVPEIRKALSRISQPSSRIFVDPLTSDGLLFSWSTVPIVGSEMNLVVVTFVNRSQIVKALFREKVKIGFFIFLVLGFGILSAIYLGSRLSQPIEGMVKAAQILEKGDFSVRVDDQRADELGDLAAAFNHMGETLDQRDQALKAANAALVQSEKLAALGTISAGLAHEVKNPLAGILGHADMAVQSIKAIKFPDQESLLRHMETIRKETKRCRGIIDNLMKFSRKDSAHSTSEFEVIDIESAAWDAIALSEHPMNLAKVKIEKKFDPNAWMIRGNANQIEQVLLNMIQNAGHAMPEGGIIRIGTEYYANAAKASLGKLGVIVPNDFKGSCVRIYISDTGQGMTEEVQKKIFEPFFTTKPKGVGTGLGLSVTMQILNDHKARLSLTSAPGQGSTFYMDFLCVKTRTKEVLKHLEEVSHHRSGGTQLASDVSSEKSLKKPGKVSGQTKSQSSAPMPVKASRPKFSAQVGNEPTQVSSSGVSPPSSKSVPRNLSAAEEESLSLDNLDMAAEFTQFSEAAENSKTTTGSKLLSQLASQPGVASKTNSGVRPPPPPLSKTNTNTLSPFARDTSQSRSGVRNTNSGITGSNFTLRKPQVKKT